MRLAQSRSIRPGAAIIEAAVIVMVFLTLVLGMLDLGIALFRYHIVSEAARQGARQAIVHGNLAPPQMAEWGPAAINTTASANGIPLVDVIRPSLVGFDLTKTRINAEWLDGDTEPESRVQVTVSVPYRPIMTFIFGNPTYNLSASSTMRISH